MEVITIDPAAVDRAYQMAMMSAAKVHKDESADNITMMACAILQAQAAIDAAKIQSTSA